MSQSFTNLIYHIIFSTKDRRPLITGACEARLHDYIGGTLRGQDGISLAINGTEDHVHVLRPDEALSDVLRDLKANASGWMHNVFPELKDFSWQRGYGAFTVSASQVGPVRDYIARQKEHHQRESFRDEFIGFLKAFRSTRDTCDSESAARAAGWGRIGSLVPGVSLRSTPGFTLTPARRATLLWPVPFSRI